MCKQTLKSSAAVIGVEHEIFTNRCAWHGIGLSAGTPITPYLCFLLQHSTTSLFNGRKSTRWARWPQIPTTPTHMKYSARICNLYECLKNRKENKQTPVYRFSCSPPKTLHLLWVPFLIFFASFFLSFHFSHMDIRAFTSCLHCMAVKAIFSFDYFKIWSGLVGGKVIYYAKSY